jgi:hypothetical protein
MSDTGNQVVAGPEDEVSHMSSLRLKSVRNLLSSSVR